MKKVLLSTSALALVGAFSSANAAEWDVKVGGYMEAMVYYADSDVSFNNQVDFDGLDVTTTDAELHFKPTITLDNGLKIGADIQIEVNNSGDRIDEDFLFIKGSFGEILLGSENSAGYKMSYGAPDVSFHGTNSNDLTAFLPYSSAVGGVNVADDLFRGTLGSTFLENDRNNDSQRITYFSPRFAGFQIGASYARDDQQDGAQAANDCNNDICNFFDIGANYVNSFGGFDIAVSGRWGIATNDAANSNNPQVWGAGINLGFAGVTIGGSFAEQNNAGDNDGRSFDAGISYETGPWGFSFTYLNGENVNDENAAAVVNGASANDEELQIFTLAASYALAKGVKLGVSGAYVDFDEQVDDGGAGNGDDVDGFIIGTGIKISF